MVGYRETRTITLRISLICLNFLFNQLLNRIPTNIVPTPIHKNGTIPETNCPITILSVIILIIPKSAGRFSAPTLVIPAGIDPAIKISPVINVNNLMNPSGVGFAQLDHALSISNALIKNAPPRIPTNTAKISAVYPVSTPIPPINHEIPGTPKKNFEYLGSYTTIFRNLPNNA